MARAFLSLHNDGRSGILSHIAQYAHIAWKMDIVFIRIRYCVVAVIENVRTASPEVRRIAIRLAADVGGWEVLARRYVRFAFSPFCAISGFVMHIDNVLYIQPKHAPVTREIKRYELCRAVGIQKTNIWRTYEL